MPLEEQEDVVAIWTSFLDWEESQGDSTRLEGIYKRTLRETLRQDAVPELHPIILAKYFDFSIAQNPSNTSLLSTLERITTTYRPSYTFFREAFDTIASRSSDPLKDLTSVYRQWRAASQASTDKVGATIHWSEWLLRHSHGKEASDAVDFMRREVGKDAAALAELETGWAGLMDAAEARDKDSNSDERSEGSEGGYGDWDVDMDMSEDEGESGEEGQDVSMVV
jgi:hypothetical protein